MIWLQSLGKMCDSIEITLKNYLIWQKIFYLIGDFPQLRLRVEESIQNYFVTIGGATGIQRSLYASEVMPIYIIFLDSFLKMLI